MGSMEYNDKMMVENKSKDNACIKILMKLLTQCLILESAVYLLILWVFNYDIKSNWDIGYQL